MNQTPRLRSAFPETPRTNLRPQANVNLRRSPPNPVKATPECPKRETLVPLEYASAPEQRKYAVALYFGLLALRIYDSWNVTDDLDSTWLFLKWLAIDAIYLVGLPAFQIPMLELSFVTVLTTWLLHAIANAFLMYHIPIPVGAWIASMMKVAYDRELAISEHRVKPADIIHNSSIILGKQIIQILPEGSAVLNPERQPFCLDTNSPFVNVPIQINQTTPILIELLRYDVDTQESETVIINAKEAKKLKRQADKGYAKSDNKTPRTLMWSTSKIGLYQLQRVVDESKLEVRKRSIDTLVARCPKASIFADMENKCKGDLSNVSLNVTGVPPFKVKYSKRIKKQPSSYNVQSIQPPELDSPLSDQQSNTLVDLHKINLEWARSTTVTVDINELLSQNGTWAYNVEEVEDGAGNKVSYESDSNDGLKLAAVQKQILAVHNRPSAFLHGCDAQSFLKVAKGRSVNLPIQLREPRQLSVKDWPLKLQYSFTPDDDSNIPSIESQTYDMGNERSQPRIDKAGKYNLESISSQYCLGDITEPSSCLLYNPPQPDMVLSSEDISDKCAGNPIGLNIDLDLTGTPPFQVQYSVSHGGYVTQMVKRFDSLRGNLELKPRAAGSYVYEFLHVQDNVYGSVSIKDKNYVLKQNVKPPASASFADGTGSIKACLDQPASANIKFEGQGPWDLEYELVHGSRRKRFNVRSEHDMHTIVTPQLTDGGQHSIVLTSVQDKSLCKTSIREERAVEVRPEQSRAAFGEIEGRRYVLALEGKSIKVPLRLKGIAPWNVQITNLDNPSVAPAEHTLWDANAAIPVSQAGKYEIISVHDTCPGLVDPNANTFEVAWIGRPTVAIKEPSAKLDGKDAFRKPAVCVGDEAAVSLMFTGNPPYHLKYQQNSRLLKGSAAVSNKQISAAIGTASIQMDTLKAGEYSYTFHELGDDRYSHSRQHFKPFSIHQEVYPLPSARFKEPGKTYAYCKNEAGGTQNIPISFDGEPPFSIEIGITHHGSSKPDILRVKDILSTEFSWSMFRRGLDLGTHSVTVRKVKDNRGCEQVIEDDRSAIRIMVSDPPTILPLESQVDYCVGEHVSYSLSGQAPFDVFYRFQGQERKARASTNTFRRIAELPGEFTISAISDNASGHCKSEKNITKIIHPMPTVKISKGRTSVVDIHEGGEVDLFFEFTGTPPFEFTYTRSENAKKGKRARVLETRNDKSFEYSKSVRASDEGTYEVVAIKDNYCAFSLQKGSSRDAGGQKLLQ